LGVNLRGIKWGKGNRAEKPPTSERGGDTQGRTGPKQKNEHFKKRKGTGGWAVIKELRRSEGTPAEPETFGKGRGNVGAETGRNGITLWFRMGGTFRVSRPRGGGRFPARAQGPLWGSLKLMTTVSKTRTNKGIGDPTREIPEKGRRKKKKVQLLRVSHA